MRCELALLRLWLQGGDLRGCAWLLAVVACGGSCCSSGADLRLHGLRGLHVGCLHALRARLQALCLAMQLKASLFLFVFSLSFSSEIKPLPGDPTPSPSSEPPGVLFIVNVC